MDTNPPPLCGLQLKLKKIGALFTGLLFSLAMMPAAFAEETGETAAESSDPMAWIVMAVSAAVILAFLCIVGRKRNRKRYKK